MNLVPTNNLYLLSGIIGLADVIGGFIFLFVAMNLKFKTTLLASFGLMVVSSFTLYGLVFKMTSGE